jgi:diguanylate cyclase (GGDEF)-like protein/PAS domain S-box-containing protein
MISGRIPCESVKVAADQLQIQKILSNTIILAMRFENQRGMKLKSNHHSFDLNTDKNQTPICPSFLRLPVLVLCGIFLLVSYGFAAQPVDVRMADASQLDQKPLSLTEYFAVLEDPSLAMTLADIQKADVSANFNMHIPAAEALSFGYTHSAYWMRLNLSNPGDRPIERMLEIGYASLSNVQFYQPVASGAYDTLTTGSALPFATRPYKNRYFVFPVTLPAHSAQVYYLRIQSAGAMLVPARLWAPQAFYEHERNDYIVQSLYFGMAIAMILFNLLLFIALRNIYYLLYVSFVTCMALAIAAQNGLTQEFLWPDATLWSDISRFVGYSLSLATMLLFMRLMLSSRKVIPKFDKLIKIFAGVLLLSPIGFAVSLATFARPAALIYVITLTLILGTGLFCALKRQRSAIYFTAGFAMLCLGGVAIPLMGMGVLPANILTMNGLQVGSTVEMLLLALALTDRFNMIRKEKTKAQQEALEAQQRLVENLQLSERVLEERIVERTEALKESESRYRTLVERSPEPLAVHRDGKVIYANPAAVKSIGARSAQDLIGKPVLDWIHPDFHQLVLERARNVAEHGVLTPVIEEKFIKMDGTVIDVEVQSTEIVFDGESAIQVALRDITGRKEAADEIMNLAFYDSLTGLPNRRLLLKRLKHALASSARSGRKGALLFIDLDNFKTLNDTLGHDIGDLLLQQVAQRLESCIGEGDTVARMGGDEFVVMLEDLSEHELETATRAEAVGEIILAALNQPYQLATHKYKSTPSIGASLFSGHELEVEELLKQADIAMYQAKKAGRNTIRFFDPQMQAVINARVSMEGELHSALENQQFQLYYQLQVDSLRRPLGAEVLIRWLHPERGLIASEQFIPLAEDTGLILPIGQWVLEMACAQLKIWQQDALTCDLVLAVNVSAKQFRKDGFVDQVQDAVQRHDINPMRLKLELTESLLMESIDDIVASMGVLNEIGIQFSLDDFGTGYSSLQYLKQLPFDQLKIDQSFVRDIASNISDRAIVRTIIAMAQSLNLSVIAEGVETEEQRQILMSKGCTHYQGYLFGKPVPIEQFEAMLQQG